MGLVPLFVKSYDANVPVDHVISQGQQAFTKIEKGSHVQVMLSKGPAPIKIPDLKNHTQDDATATLDSLGLASSIAQAYATKVPAGDVISTNPPAGKLVPKGSTVVLTVSLGPKQFKMPDVVGMTKEQAVALLESKGLKVSIQMLPPSPPPDTVVFQSPQAGTTVQQGETVTIYVTGS